MQVSVREATPAAKKSKTVASKADVEEGPGPLEIHGAAKVSNKYSTCSSHLPPSLCDTPLITLALADPEEFN